MRSTAHQRRMASHSLIHNHNLAPAPSSRWTVQKSFADFYGLVQFLTPSFVADSVRRRWLPPSAAHHFRQTATDYVGTRRSGFSSSQVAVLAAESSSSSAASQQPFVRFTSSLSSRAPPQQRPRARARAAIGRRESTRVRECPWSCGSGRSLRLLDKIAFGRLTGSRAAARFMPSSSRRQSQRDLRRGALEFRRCMRVVQVCSASL